MKRCKEEGDIFKHGGLFEILEDLSRTLSFEKTVDETRSRLYIDGNDIYDFDAMTRGPVTRVELSNGYALITDVKYESYASAISGGKLSTGDVISETTHLSLVAG